MRVDEVRTELDTGAGELLGHILVFGDPDEGCLVRIHSRCLYGDALGSQDCDCGAELDMAMDMIQAEGHGVLVYLEQEGRGSGLIVKAMGLRLGAQTGVDTFTSYRMLGHPIDSRSYGHAAQALSGLGLAAVRLMTNNPDKVAALEAAGFEVRTVPLLTEPRSERARLYMESKREVCGHRSSVSAQRWPRRAVRGAWGLVRNAYSAG
ncbi:GTP cyclohydrolase II [Nocardia sp. NBC_01503]|uniref:GTP cyclohydrolase II n=1 Tax=Nocardia sp. NBC_01503 TaxID=2975997 RepID=UPI002E7BB082|nr:GTP cyclohydrolase II [Nocardia sp. NBC_01503]WTL31362.1 GTP cyclohydrolase II [Nocardia sp. NBC_01503]